MVYFKPHEFKMGDKVVYDKMNKVFLMKLDMLRDLAGIPFIITSSYRDEEYNAKVGGNSNSQHLKGRAVDIKVSNGFEKYQIVKGCIALGLSFGIANTFIHVDDREGVDVCWTY